MTCWALPPRISSTSLPDAPDARFPGGVRAGKAVRGKGRVCIGCRFHRDGGAERAEAERFYAGLETLEGLDGCEAFTLLELDADNTGATVE